MNLKGNYHVYRSSAGSGKTFTLAKFYLSLILKNDSPNYFKHILAITFTVKAAAEMKHRIIHYLSGFASSQKLSKDHELMLSLISKELDIDMRLIQKKSNPILNAILHDYSNLAIFTIDKFVHKLVRSFATELGLSPDFEVEIDSKQLIERVVSETLNKVGIDKDITRLIRQYSKGQVESDKLWDVTASLESLASELNSEDFYLNAKDLGDISPSIVFEIQHQLKIRYDKISVLVQIIGQKAIDLIELHSLSSKDFANGGKGVFGFFMGAANKDLIKVSKPNTYVLKALEDDKWQSSTKSEVVLDIKNELHAQLYQLIENQSQIRHALFCQKLIPQLYKTGLISEFQLTFSSLKFEDNQQLLSDFYKLLSDKFENDQTPFIYERLGNKFHHILIDEFQDTSQLQWKNLLPLVENSISEGHSSLIVGDAKQSIYRFRGSEPGQFINQPNNNRPSDQLLRAEFNPFVLDSNYRSSKAIVDFNNRFFSELSNTFLEENHRTYYSDVTQKSTNESAGQVSFNAIAKIDGLTNQELLFEPIYNRIKSLLEIDEVDPGDICLLFQKNSDASYFAGKLLQFGFPVTSDESLLLMNNNNIQLIISTIQAQANPCDQFYLQLWLSRIYQMEAISHDYHEHALWLKTGKCSFRQLSNRLNLGLKEDTFNQDSFRIIWEIIKKFKLNKDDIFIKSFLDFALLYDENAAYLKTSFTDYWNLECEKLSIENSSYGSIQVMTIHKSKGLEFEHVLVFLPEFQQRKTTKKFAWIEDLGLDNLKKTMVNIDSLSGTDYEDVLDEEKSNSSVDLINALYVALTRPKNTLDVFTLAKDGNIVSKPIRFIQNWNEWDSKNAVLRISL